MISKLLSLALCSSALVVLSACGGGGGSTGNSSAAGGGSGGSTNAYGSLTISNATNSSFNGSRNAAVAPTKSTWNTFDTYRYTLDGGTGSEASFKIDTSNNTLVDGDTLVKLVSGSTAIDAGCENNTCPGITLNTSTRTLTFTNQRYTEFGGGSAAFTVNGSLKY